MGAAEIRAERGAKFMDSVIPGWAEMVNTSTLNICSEDNCVFGQCYGSYNKGIEKTGLKLLKSIRFGFLSGRLVGCKTSDQTKAWIPEILRRQKAAA